tara:strand:- start:2319 stop:3605 length:1287 start_codon:yes stop_codon:yes gene_type:complete
MIFKEFLNFTTYKTLILKEVSFQLIEKIIRIIFGLVVVKAISFYLGPANYGVLNFIESYYLMLYGLAIFGLDIVVTKKFVKLKGKNKLGEFVFNCIIILLIISLFFFIINTFTLINFIDIEYKNLIFLISMLLFLNPILIIEYFLISENKLRYISIIKSIAYIISSSLKLAAVYFEYDLEVFILIIIIENILTYGGYLFLFRKQIHNINFKLNLNLQSQILKESFPIFLYSLGAIIYSRIDIFMIQKYLSDEDLGYYSASFKLVIFLLFLPGILSSSFFPKIVYESDKSLESNYIRKMYRYTFSLSIIVSIICYLIGPFMIDILFGSKFESSLIIFNILIFMIIISSISAVYGKVIYSVNLQNRLLLRSIIGIIINISCNYILIIRYGVIGSAIATIISLLFIELVYDFFDPYLKPYHKFKLKSIFTI